MGESSQSRFHGYSYHHFQRDLLSGLIVGVIAIPLGMAFAIASGVRPEYGIYTTIIAGILISLFGGSKFQIGGPTGAFIPILLGIVMTYGYENLLIAGFMAGVMLLLMGLLRLGSLIKFIPKPVTIGFTAGIAVIIFTGQISSFLGLSEIVRHEDFISNMKEIWLHLNTFSFYSLIISMISLSLILITPRMFPKVPGPLIGLVVSSAVAAFFFPDKVATIGSAFGEIPSSLPTFHFPEISLETCLRLLQPALVIALLGGIESLLSAVVADGMSGSRHNSNRELIGQGIANMITPLFGGIPATGAIARTATNIRNGAASPLSGVIHGLVVLVVLLLLAPYASHIPLASMAPILMVVAWNMSERHEFLHILRTRTSDSFILVITFLLTVFTNLTLAVEVGLILATILFVKRMSEILTIVKVIPDPFNPNNVVIAHLINDKKDCNQISIYTVKGPLFFGAAQMFEKSLLHSVHNRLHVLILRMSNVPYMDTTGESNLKRIIQHFRDKGCTVYLSGLQPQPKKVLMKTGLLDTIGRENLFQDSKDAMIAAVGKLEPNKCIGCPHYENGECTLLSYSKTEYLREEVMH
ncbi:SulP family inorganic anion transporter [Brevibacillus sp. SYSU BS000544]|uniref:SulP family inorganic anion transporter n=1 Tax=Brevibacillus sp. SYSU BS000544 TaxID=3416443 RepID=UPI003CE5BB06